MGRQMNSPLNQNIGLRCCSEAMVKYAGPFSQFVGGVELFAEFSGLGNLVLDTRIDWRDRVLRVSGMANLNSTTLPNIDPGSLAPQNSLSGAGVLRGEIFCTGSGWTGNIADPPGTLVTYCQFHSGTSFAPLPQYYLYADSITGHLKILTGVASSGVFMITATEQTGKIIPVP